MSVTNNISNSSNLFSGLHSWSTQIAFNNPILYNIMSKTILGITIITALVIYVLILSQISVIIHKPSIINPKPVNIPNKIKKEMNKATIISIIIFIISLFLAINVATLRTKPDIKRPMLILNSNLDIKDNPQLMPDVYRLKPKKPTSIIVNNSDFKVLTATWQKPNYVVIKPNNNAGESYLTMVQYLTKHKIKNNSINLHIKVAINKTTATYNTYSGPVKLTINSTSPNKIIKQKG